MGRLERGWTLLFLELQLLVYGFDMDRIFSNGQPLIFELFHLLAFLFEQPFDDFLLLVAFEDWVFFEPIDFLLFELLLDLVRDGAVDYHAEELLHGVEVLPILRSCIEVGLEFFQ